MTAVLVTVGKANLLTMNGRYHHQARARVTRVLRLAGSLAATSQGLPRFERAHVVVHVSWPDRRRRDVHNIFPTIKALIDGFVDAECLPDDDDRHLIGPDLRVTDELSGIPGVVRLRLEFEEIP